MKTVLEIYPEYIEYLSLKNKITTINSTKYKFKNHILPYFKDFKVNEITVESYIKFIFKLKEHDYNYSFYSRINSICLDFFEYLTCFHDMKDISKVIKNMGLNIGKKPHKKRDNTWTYKEYKLFIKEVDDPILHALFNTLYFTGIRKGEAFALKIEDFRNNVLIIDKTLSKENINGKRTLLYPKTENAIRTIRIDNFLKKELDKLIKYYKKIYSNFNTDFFLFGGVKPIAPTTLERKKNKYCKIANVKQIRIHDFRHSHATMLYKQKIDIKSIQERLGHARIDTTISTYVHLNEKQEKKLITRINLIKILDKII